MTTTVRATEEPQKVVERSYPEGGAQAPTAEELILPSEPRKLFRAGGEYRNFLNEEVEVMIHPSYNPKDTTRLVSVSVNGKSYYFMRGQWKKVPRFVVENLCAAKKEAWTFSYAKAPDGTTIQKESAMQNLAYPFDIRDPSAKGRAWLQWLLEKQV